jgi:hypothetical protein
MTTRQISLDFPRFRAATSPVVLTSDRWAALAAVETLRRGRRVTWSCLVRELIERPLLAPANLLDPTPTETFWAGTRPVTSAGSVVPPLRTD